MQQNRTIKVAGNHYEVGKQVGELYSKWGKRELYLPNVSDQVFNKQLELYKTHFPAYLDWLEGVAKGADFDKERTIKSYLTGFLDFSSRPQKSCSVFGLKQDGKVFVGRNYDWRAATEQSAHKLEVALTDANSFTAISDMGVWKMGADAESNKFLVVVDDAWNEHGLFICLNGVHGKSAEFGMNCDHIVQAAIEQCKTTSEAVELITKSPAMTQSCSRLLISWAIWPLLRCVRTKK